MILIGEDRSGLTVKKKPVPVSFFHHIFRNQTRAPRGYFMPGFYFVSEDGLQRRHLNFCVKKEKKIYQIDH